MKSQALNKIAYSVMESFNATKIFSIYNKDKDGKIFLNINMCRNKKSLCKHKISAGSLCLVMSLVRGRMVDNHTLKPSSSV
jgi:hypothetical protein